MCGFPKVEVVYARQNKFSTILRKQLAAISAEGFDKLGTTTQGDSNLFELQYL